MNKVNVWATQYSEHQNNDNYMCYSSYPNYMFYFNFKLLENKL